jgi:hypothetical protein
LKEALQELSECGDLVEMSTGQWLPAPTREVRLGTADDMRLLVGGFPTSLLPVERAAQIEHLGPYRRVKGNALSKEFELPQQSLEGWMGHAPNDLREWTQSVLEGSYERHSPTGRSIEVYAPELSSVSTPQMFRWVDRTDKLSGIYLSREELPFGGKRHYTVKIAKGQIIGIRTMPPFDFRRLLYGLDLLAEKAVMGRFLTAPHYAPLLGVETRVFRSRLKGVTLLGGLRGLSDFRPASLLGGSNPCPGLGRKDLLLGCDGSRPGL